jgi:hypothetical protein
MADVFPLGVEALMMHVYLTANSVRPKPATFGGAELPHHIFIGLLVRGSFHTVYLIVEKLLWRVIEYGVDRVLGRRRVNDGLRARIGGGRVRR